jgi:hypothetical protein
MAGQRMSTAVAAVIEKPPFEPVTTQPQRAFALLLSTYGAVGRGDAA